MASCVVSTFVAHLAFGDEKTTVTNSIGMKLERIPAGEFQMGSPESEQGRERGERQHRVRITRPFFLGKFEVTQGEFQKVIGWNPSKHSRKKYPQDTFKDLDTDRFPVETVTWYDAVEFCNKMSVLEKFPQHYKLSEVQRDDEKSIKKAVVMVVPGPGYRLPTEAEWEYACRAGTTTPFHFGSQSNGRDANVDGNDPYGTTTKGPYLMRPTTIGSYRSNSFGLHDMHGNIGEWCSDWWDSEYYPVSPTADPHGPATGELRILRGGFWTVPMRAAYRGASTPDQCDEFQGFRVARDSRGPGAS